MKAITLEEAAERYDKKYIEYVYDAFIEGAKWQAERMYSEQDMKKAYLDGCKIQLTNIYHLEEWFEQFKKK